MHARPAMARVRTWAVRLGLAGMALFLAAAILAAWVYVRLPQEPGSGAGFIVVLIAWCAYLFMSACNAIAVAALTVARYKTSLPLRRSERVFLLTAAICQVMPLIMSS